MKLSRSSHALPVPASPRTGPRRSRAALVAAPLLAVLLGPAIARAGGGPENVLVVVNDLCPESGEIGRRYLHARDVPRHHVVHVQIPGAAPKTPPKAGEPVPFVPVGQFPGGYDGFEEMLAVPVRRWLDAHPEAHITMILLTRGIPVVTGVKDNPAIRRGTAHMLSILAVEGDGLRTASEQKDFRPNPIHGTDRSIDPRHPENDTPIYGVGLLDAFTLEDVDRMIDLAVRSDAARPDGTVYLGRSRKGDARGIYNGAFPKLVEWMTGLGLRSAIVEHPGTNLLLDGKEDVVYYAYGQAGWDPGFPARNRYLPGAVIDNLTSVALTWKAFDPAHEGGQTPMTHFLAAGATVVHGCVLEPFTGAWDPGYLHLRRYLEGYNVLESFYMGHPWLPWMNLVAGDPLTQPFAVRPEVTVESFGEAEEGSGKPSGTHVLRVRAKARRPETGIREIRLYVDGVLRGEVAADTAEFDLEGFDPGVGTWRVVAIDDSRFRTQGSAASEPLPAKVGKVKVTLSRFSRGKAKFKVSADRTAVYTWACATAEGPKTGTGKGRSFTLDLEGEGPHVVDVWIRNARGRAAFTIPLAPKGKRR